MSSTVTVTGKCTTGLRVQTNMNLPPMSYQQGRQSTEEAVRELAVSIAQTLNDLINEEEKEEKEQEEEE